MIEKNVRSKVLMIWVLLTNHCNSRTRFQYNCKSSFRPAWFSTGPSSPSTRLALSYRSRFIHQWRSYSSSTSLWTFRRRLTIRSHQSSAWKSQRTWLWSLSISEFTAQSLWTYSSWRSGPILLRERSGRSNEGWGRYESSFRSARYFQVEIYGGVPHGTCAMFNECGVE